MFDRLGAIHDPAGDWLSDAISVPIPCLAPVVKEAAVTTNPGPGHTWAPDSAVTQAPEISRVARLPSLSQTTEIVRDGRGSRSPVPAVNTKLTVCQSPHDPRYPRQSPAHDRRTVLVCRHSV